MCALGQIKPEFLIEAKMTQLMLLCFGMEEKGSLKKITMVGKLERSRKSGKLGFASKMGRITESVVLQADTVTHGARSKIAVTTEWGKYAWICCYLHIFQIGFPYVTSL